MKFIYLYRYKNIIKKINNMVGETDMQLKKRRLYKKRFYWLRTEYQIILSKYNYWHNKCIVTSRNSLTADIGRALWKQPVM